MTQPQKVLNAVVDVVLAYRPSKKRKKVKRKPIVKNKQSH